MAGSLCNIVKNLDVEFKEEADAVSREPLKVYLRIRPLTVAERKENENQECIIKKADNLVELQAPPNSFAFKSSNRGFDQINHQFSFSRVFSEQTTQKEFFNQTMLPFVEDILKGHNGLVFTYGVTNSGKTYTFQGTPKDGGILTRALDVIYNSIEGRTYAKPNVKPKFCNEVTYLSKGEESKEEDVRNVLFNHGEKENVDLSLMKKLNSTSKTEKTVLNSRDNTFFSNISVIQKSGGGSVLDIDIDEEIRSRITDETNVDVEIPPCVKFAMWVSFYEIYNELIHDLLDVRQISKKRPSLKLGEDKNGNPYVRGLKEVFVTSSDEAYKILRVGQKQKHIAATKANQNSSRSHSIFSIKLMKIFDDGKDRQCQRISRLSIVDLAGSERYSKTDAYGVVLKEASNINSSIMTLGKCIHTLRSNQEHPSHPTIVPFRESKLTRLFQSYFRGKGKASMIVNISPCASVFDETYNVLKFSSVAKEIKMKAERATEMWHVPPVPPSILDTPRPAPSTPAPSKRPPLCIVTPVSTVKKERSLNNPQDYNYSELCSIVKELNEKIKKERKEKASLEKTLRAEITHEMDNILNEADETHRDELREQRANMSQAAEDRLENLTRTVEKQRKRRRLRDESDDGNVVSTVLFEAEKEKVSELESTMENVQSHIRKLESENTKLRAMEKSMRELEEIYKMQNKSMKEMQKNIQEKDDEIEKLRDELDDSQRNPTDDHIIEENERKIDELEKVIEEKDKELLFARANLQNRDVYIGQLEKKALSVDDYQKEIDELKSKIKESEDNYHLVRFETDEKDMKIEKYENTIQQQQDTLTDSDDIIVQLNENLFLLKAQLANEQERHIPNGPTNDASVNTSLRKEEQIESFEIGTNTSVLEKSVSEHNDDINLMKAEKVQSSGNKTSITKENEIEADISMLEDSLITGTSHISSSEKPQLFEVGTNTSLLEKSIVENRFNMSLGKEEVSSSEIGTNTSVLKDPSVETRLDTSLSKEEKAISSEIGTNTSVLENPSVDIGVNTSLFTEECRMSADIGTNTSIIQPGVAMEPGTKQVEEVGVNNSFTTLLKVNSPQIKQIAENASIQFSTPCQKKEPRSEIESIEGFSLVAKSISKIRREEDAVTPENYNTPRKAGTPAKIKKMSPYSPASKSVQQTIKQFEKLLEEAKKDAEKKTSLLITRNNRIQQLESQLHALEKKNNLKKMLEEKSALQDNLTSLTEQLQEMTDTLKEKNELVCSTTNEIKVWMNKTEKCQAEINKSADEVVDWRNKYNDKQEETQCLVDNYISQVSVLTNSKMELMKELEPMKTALREFEEEKSEMEKKNETQFQQIKEDQEKFVNLENMCQSKKKECDQLKREVVERDDLLLKLQQEKDNLATQSSKLNKDLADRRKSRVIQQNTLETSLDGFKERIITLEKENEENLEEISSLRKTIFEVQSKSNDVEICYKEALVAKEMLAKSEKDLTIRVEELDSKNTQSELEISKLNNIKMKQDITIQALEKEKEEVKIALEGEIDDLKKQYQLLTEKVESVSEELAEIKRKEHKLLIEKDAHFEQLSRLEEENRENYVLIESLKTEKEEAELETNRYMKELKESVQEKTENILLLESLKKEKDNASTEMDEYRKGLKEKDLMIESLTSEKEEAVLEKNRYVEKLKESEQEKTENILLLESMKKEKDDASTEMDEYLEEQKEKDLMIEWLKTAKEEAELENNRYVEELKKSEQEKGENVLLIESLMKENDNALTEMDEYRKGLKEKDLMIESLTSEKEEAKSKSDNDDTKELIESYTKRISEYEQEQTNRNKLLESVKREKNQVLSEVENYLKQISAYKQEIDENVLIIESLTKEKEDLLKKEKELEKQNAENLVLIESMCNDKEEENIPTSTRRSTRNSAKKTPVKKSSEGKGRGKKANDASKTSLIVIDEDESDVVEQMSIACSPLKFDALESTRCDHVPNSTISETANFTLDLTKNSNTMIEDDTLSTTPRARRRKRRLHSVKTAVFQESPDDVERTTGNEKEILEATLPMTIGGKRVTRAKRK